MRKAKNLRMTREEGSSNLNRAQHEINHFTAWQQGICHNNMPNYFQRAKMSTKFHNSKVHKDRCNLFKLKHHATRNHLTGKPFPDEFRRSWNDEGSHAAYLQLSGQRLSRSGQPPCGPEHFLPVSDAVHHYEMMKTVISLIGQNECMQ